MIGVKAAEAAVSAAGPPNLNTALMLVAIGLIGMLIRSALAYRKMTLSDNTGLRREFIDEMKNLRDEVKTLRDENRDLREEVRGLHGVIDAMRQANRSTQDLVAQALRAEDDATIRARLNQIPNGGIGL